MSSYRLVRLTPGEGPDAWPLPRRVALIGRRDSTGTSPDVDLAPDRNVSRQHARIWFDERGCWIEDTNSRRGTWLGSRRVPPQAPHACALGAELRIGSHSYAVFGPNWHRLRHQGCVVDVVLASPFGYALEASGAPLVPRLSVRNWNGRPAPATRLDLELGDVARARWSVPRLAPGEVHAVVPGVEIKRDALLTLSEHLTLGLQVHLGGERIDGNSVKCIVLAGDEWAYGAEYRLALAAFVLPADPIVVHASRVATKGMPLQAGGAAVLERLFEHLANDWRIDYRKDRPPAPSGSQKLRLPADILWDSAGRCGEGTCIDLALLLAAGLESLRLPPLLALVDLGRSWHALVGTWRDRRRRVELLPADRRSLLEQAVWADPNACTVDPAQRASFAEASERAQRLLAERPLLFALDVAATRSGGCRPRPGREPTAPLRSRPVPPRGES